MLHLAGLVSVFLSSGIPRQFAMVLILYLSAKSGIPFASRLLHLTRSTYTVFRSLRAPLLTDH